MTTVKRKLRVTNGRLTQQGDKFKSYRDCWGVAVFLCECGNRLILNVSDVSRDQHKSCGCIRREKLVANRITKAVSGVALSEYSITKVKEMIQWTTKLPTAKLPTIKVQTYVLKLEGNCWYIGKTAKLVERINAHFSKTPTVVWLRKHKPIEVCSVVDGDCEKELTLSYTRSYGHEFVRGYAWCQVERVKPPKGL